MAYTDTPMMYTKKNWFRRWKKTSCVKCVILVFPRKSLKLLYISTGAHIYYFRFVFDERDAKICCLTKRIDRNFRRFHFFFASLFIVIILFVGCINSKYVKKDMTRENLFCFALEKCKRILYRVCTV